MAAKPARKVRHGARMVRGPHCPRCDHELPVDGGERCPACKKPFTCVRFTPPSRLHREVDSAGADTTACANHESNLAVDACGRCGAFICTLCRMETDELVACPACLEQLEREGALASLRKELTNYGYLALSVAAGVVMIPVAPLFAVPALVYARRNVRQNRLLGERLGVYQGWFAVVLALLGVLGSVAFWFAIVAKVRR